MRDPLLLLAETHRLDPRMRDLIGRYYKARGKKAMDIVDQDRVERYRDFFVVSGDTSRYVVEDDFCSCGDFLHRGGACAHILAVKIARAIGRYTLVDTWYHEHLSG